MFAVNAMTHNYVVAQELSKQTEFMEVPIQRQFVSELTMELLSTNETSDFDACEEGHTSELVLKNLFWCSTNIVLKNYCGKVNEKLMRLIPSQRKENVKP